MDAKVATADMASHLMLWGEIGRPNQREWLPQHNDFAKNDGLYPSGYYLFRGDPPAGVRAALQSPQAETNSNPDTKASDTKASAKRVSYKDRVWKGWVLPASEADTWFVAGSARYYEELQSEDLEKSMDAVRARYRRLKLEPENAATRVRIEENKGVLFLDSLRRKIGDDAFFKLMNDFFRANTTKTVTAQAFLDKAGVTFTEPDPGRGAVYLTSDIGQRLSSAVLVYGTLREAGANRYAAECLQRDFLNSYESQIPIYKDFEATDDVLRHHNIIFVGRPESNSALAAWAGKLNIDSTGASFRIAGNVYASEREAFLLAAQSPLDPARMVLVVAGNDALRTVKLAKSVGDRSQSAEYVVLDDGRPVKSGFLGMHN